MPAEKFYDSTIAVEGDTTEPIVTIAWGYGTTETPEPGPYINGAPFDRSGINRMIRALKKARDQVFGADE